ncbi:NfeD family protein [Bacillus marasmi]|uniref:NfeD family protein n=1 Tax=Bacillus marasmi TaxID=1926279 RepID=UPI0011C7E375|nr:NfeD family protein [Bacillus marasmi]
MELFGTPLEAIYLYALIISGAVTIIYLFFGDVLSGLLDGIINPTLIFSFVTIFSAGGYLCELFTSFHSGLIAAFNAAVALILVTLLNVFVLIPISKAEESLVYRESDLRGRIGMVITTVPEDGYGEVLIESVSGRVSKPAISFKKKEIPNGKKVLIIDVVNGVLQVENYEETDNFF